ncbi:MAG: AAA family ATPase [Lacipirellulaceae bacterium]
MRLTNSLSEHVRACFSGIWVETAEPEEALTEIRTLCEQQAWHLAHWNLETGLTLSGQGTAPDANLTAEDPLTAVRAASELASADTPALLVLENFHRFLQSSEIVQALAEQLNLGKQQRTFLVVLAPTVELPLELEKRFVVLQHSLPDREQLLTIARELATEPGELPEGQPLQKVLEAAAGLTRLEAEGAMSLSLIRHGQLQPETLWHLKSQQLKKSRLLTLHEGNESFSSLGGLQALKAFCLQALRSQQTTLQAKGVLLLSPPGCGKSAFCKALGNEVGRPTLRLDMGALMGSLVGQSEANLRRALAQAEAMAPCVLMIDEIEKGLAGSNTGAADSGVSARLFGTLLSWLADREPDVFVVATANQIEPLPAELTRAERFDGVFFVDLPGAEERQAIWSIHRTEFQIGDEQSLPTDTDWTGAEIRACCRLAKLLGNSLAETAQQVVPVAVSSAESISKLRRWASGRCLSANQPGIYQTTTVANGQRRRGLNIKPSAN